MSGTSRGQATETTRAPASRACTTSSYRPLATVASVASRPIRRFRVAWTAAWASGTSTPTIGTASDSCRAGRAADVAALHAATISLTPLCSRYEAISYAYRRISSCGLGPYGQRALSPR